MDEKLIVIDQGNSLTKLTLFDGERLVERRKLESPTPDDILNIVDAAGADGGIYCNVGQIDVKLAESLRLLLEDSFIVLTHHTPVPIRVDYRPAEAIGLDRVAALVGAWEERMTEPCLVVDAGTAITADLLMPPGQFGGGAISPGVRMRLRSLHAYTARLPEIDLREEESPICGDSTRESMLSGCVWGAAFELADRFRVLCRDKGVEKMVLTGGDAPMLADRIRKAAPEIQLELAPALVAVGLKKIFEYQHS